MSKSIQDTTALRRMREHHVTIVMVADVSGLDLSTVRRILDPERYANSRLVSIRAVRGAVEKLIKAMGGDTQGLWEDYGPLDREAA